MMTYSIFKFIRTTKQGHETIGYLSGIVATGFWHSNYRVRVTGKQLMLKVLLLKTPRSSVVIALQNDYFWTEKRNIHILL